MAWWNETWDGVVECDLGWRGGMRPGMAWWNETWDGVVE